MTNLDRLLLIVIALMCIVNFTTLDIKINKVIEKNCELSK